MLNKILQKLKYFPPLKKTHIAYLCSKHNSTHSTVQNNPVHYINSTCKNKIKNQKYLIGDYSPRPTSTINTQFGRAATTGKSR